jgi:hypothetical protein
MSGGLTRQPFYIKGLGHACFPVRSRRTCATSPTKELLAAPAIETSADRRAASI